MRVVIQRVTKASVAVNDEIISSIGRGLCILVGISRDDSTKDMDYIVRKILNVRIFEDEGGKKWSCSIKDKQLEVLCVSQFTLYHILKGNKLDFHSAMSASKSEEFYNKFLNKLRSQYEPDLIKDGKFGAYMQVSIENDGPVTLNIESPSKKAEEASGSSNPDEEES